jgi:hypothetical protein
MTTTRSHLDVGYYAEMQKRLFAVFDYVSCHKSNFETYSTALASIFLDAATFFDSLAQQFIRSHCAEGKVFQGVANVSDFNAKLSGGKRFFNIDDYRSLFEAEFQFSKKILNLNTHGDDFYSPPTACLVDPSRCFDVCPFETWANGKNPNWWGSYNKVKHDRITHIQRATLGNTLFAFGAVVVLLTVFHETFMKQHRQALETYRLFTPRYWKVKASATIMFPIFA